VRQATAIVVHLVLAAFPAALTGQEAFRFSEVTPSIYLAIPVLPAWGANSNAAVFILDDGVLIVDSHSRPSTARALVNDLRRITDKPVRYVVNSHFHYDHAQGNHAYAWAWPSGAELISSEATRLNLERIGVARMKADMVMLPDSAVAWRRRAGEATDSASRAALLSAADDAARYVAELRSMELVLPTMTFEDGLTIRRGGQTVHILFLGRGHTSGDVVVYLPDERVVATGDLLHVWTPFLWDAYPYEWVRTLEALEKLEFDRILPGHGDVITGKAQIRLWRDYLSDLLREVEREVGLGHSKAQTVAAMTPLFMTRYGAKFPAGALEGYLKSAIEKVWDVVALPVR
jgi:glyoxylase-like metal-dependent hydrolase (beta-lactamase superfamily II)